MSLWDVLLGRSRPASARREPLFAASTAIVTLQVELGLTPAGRAGLCLHPAGSQEFRQAEGQMDDLLRLAALETHSRITGVEDQYRYRWVIAEDEDWEDLVSLVHMAGETVSGAGFGPQLLAAAFRLRPREGPAAPHYLIYAYKRGKFYPFVPTAGAREERDHAAEMRMMALLEREMPWEKDLTRWYPLWGCPV